VYRVKGVGANKSRKYALLRVISFDEKYTIATPVAARENAANVLQAATFIMDIIHVKWRLVLRDANYVDM